MPLRLVNKQRTHKMTACGTTFHVISMSIGDKEKLHHDILTLSHDPGACDRLLDIISPAIVRIEGYEELSPRDVLGKMEDLKQLQEIVQAIIAHCQLTESESKNLSSSSEQLTPGSAGNAVKDAAPGDEPASITQEKTV